MLCFTTTLLVAAEDDDDAVALAGVTADDLEYGLEDDSDDVELPTFFNGRVGQGKSETP